MSGVSKFRYYTSLPDGDKLFSVFAENKEQAIREVQIYLAHRYALFGVKATEVEKLIFHRQPTRLTQTKTLFTEDGKEFEQHREKY